MPNIFLAIGGPHASIYPEHVFAKTHADVVAIGEGEETLCELLDSLKNNNDYTKIKGIAFKKRDGVIERTERRLLTEDLDIIPYPFYEGFKNFNFKNYAGFAGLPRPTASIITSRGCVFDCTYCGSVNFWGRKWRYRSAQNVLDEIEHLVKKMGACSIYIFDDNFPVNKKRVMDICQGIIERKLNIQWACCSHVKMVSEELLSVMKESGCVSIDFGVESGSDRILKKINKKQARAATLSYHRKLLALSKLYDLDANIIWTGQLNQSELAWCYQNCAMFIITSRMETFGMVALEAMANGCLCIAAENPPFPEIFLDCAYYYSPKDSHSLGDAIKNVLGWNNQEKLGMAEKAKKRAEYFSWDKALDGLIREFEVAIKA